MPVWKVSLRPSQGRLMPYTKDIDKGTAPVTITERNQKRYDLRVKMDKLNAELAWIKQEIWMTKDQYDRQNLDLYTEMFSN